jgi:hypothetical protein
MNKTFYHQTVTTGQIEHYFSQQAKYDYGKVFDQYLRTTQIPQLELHWSEDGKKVSFRWTNCVKGFDLPLVLKSGDRKVRVIPAEEWKSYDLQQGDAALFDKEAIIKMYYIVVK